MPQLRDEFCNNPWDEKARRMKLPTRIHQLAEAANWPAIRRDGLLSTKTLLDVAGRRGDKRNRIECHENEGYAVVHMHQLISELPTKQQEALHLRYFAGLGYMEIANALGVQKKARGQMFRRP